MSDTDSREAFADAFETDDDPLARYERTFDRIFEFVSDLRTDEAATVERVRRELDRSAADERAAADDD